ncbi:MAG: SMC family ATPase [Acidobacteria bacterium]|nr:SMC family ATPase [Acidobacteriota bacterium]
MRPLRLEVEGFTSFVERQSVDFSGLDLFAVTGPTGAGKSSLIDALVFALYGQVPRVGDDYKQLISHGADRLSVLLEFEVGGESYRIARTARRAGASKQRLERLEGDEARALADKARDIRARIETILGLDYDGFTRAVVLPQGQFDEFLKGEPKERRKILVSLLSLGIYDAMQKLANQRSRDARREVGFLTEQLERDFAEATPGTLEARKADLARAEEGAAAVGQALAALEEGLTLAGKARTARRQAEALERDVAQEEKRLREAEETQARGDEARADLETEVKALAERMDGLGFDPERHTALVAARPRAEQLARLRGQGERLEQDRTRKQEASETGRKSVAVAAAAVPSAEEERAGAEAVLEAAREAREEAHRQHAAVALRRELRVGEPCPVCEQRVPAVPKGGAPALDAVKEKVESAEKAARAAAVAAERARLTLQKAEGEVAGLEKDLARLEEQAGELAPQVGTLERALGEAGYGDDDLRDPAALVARIASDLEGLERARKERSELESARSGLEKKRVALEKDLARASAQRDAARARLEEIGGRRAEALGLVEESLPLLARLAASGGWEGLAAPGDGRDEVDVLEGLRVARHDESRDLAARVGALKAEVERIGRKIERAVELREKKERLDADAALLKTLADHLRADELVAWVQEEALARLAEDGSRHLGTLSQGRYALRLGSGEAAAAGSRAEQDFFVVDRWNADGVRSVKTLSGGETFLASLALALALAESLARLSAGGRAADALDSLFLDEGFGALDGETLDTVVSALDALHGGQRLVGVVTHVRDLAERMPARLEVRRSGRTAHAVVV